MDEISQVLTALGHFKDWTNYLLVTSVAALGWVATKDEDLAKKSLRRWIVAFLAASIVFAIFTLALIPLIAQDISVTTKSFYDIPTSFQLFYLWGPELTLKIKVVCWPQHAFFVVAVTLFAFGHWTTAEKR